MVLEECLVTNIVVIKPTLFKIIKVLIFIKYVSIIVKETCRKCFNSAFV